MKLRLLGEVCDVIGGGTPSKKQKEYYGGDIPWATVRDMGNQNIVSTEHSITLEGLNNSSAKVIPSGEVIIATRVGLGKACLLQQDTAINQDLRGIIPRVGVELDRRYLFYWFQSIAGKIISAGTGATVQGVKLPFVKSLLIPLPPLEEQKRIVAVLDEAFEGLETARANAEANLKNAEELFQSYLQQCFGEKAYRKDWRLKTLSEVCAIDKTKHDGNARTYVGLEDIEAHTGTFIGTRFPKKMKSETFAFDSRHVLYGRLRAYLNKLIIPNFQGHCSSEIFPLLPSHELEREYLFYWLSSDIINARIDATSTGARMPRANMNEVFKFEILIPSIEDQRRIVSKLDDMRANLSSVKQRYKGQSENIKTLRQSLLQKAFAGELT